VLPLYTPRAAAELLAVRESWLRRRAAARAVPCTFLGRHLRFSRADLEAIAQAAARAPALPPGERDRVPGLDQLTRTDEPISPTRDQEARPPRRRGPIRRSAHPDAAAASAAVAAEREQQRAA
jgi:excisionase family DNA binding protein